MAVNSDNIIYKPIVAARPASPKKIRKIAAAIKNCSDAGYFNAGFLIPENTSDEDKEAILAELNAQKYSLDSSIALDGLHLNIKWDNPLP